MSARDSTKSVIDRHVASGKPSATSRIQRLNSIPALARVAGVSSCPKNSLCKITNVWLPSGGRLEDCLEVGFEDGLRDPADIAELSRKRVQRGGNRGIGRDFLPLGVGQIQNIQQAVTWHAKKRDQSAGCNMPKKCDPHVGELA